MRTRALIKAMPQGIVATMWRQRRFMSQIYIIFCK